jgi:arylsulfatase A-like enzyme/parvulin-like peptidyl-prolyl isomerase
MLLSLLLAAAGGPPNLVLITIDTLRADRVGAYGRAGAQTATLDRLAREGVLLEDAVVQVPQTRPSHASIFTGRHPYEHGLRDNFSPPLDRKHPLLAELLRAKGWAAGGFIGAYPVSRDSGLDRGFQVFDDPFTGAAVAAREERSERRAAEVVDKALAWLDGVKGQRFFLWVHVFDPHHPYEPPAPWRQRFAQDGYDGEVAYADAQLGRLLDWLDRSGLRDSTLVVATSDHGEGLGDHGEDEHMLFVYDSTLRVPLLLRWPGVLPAGARVRGQFRSVDLLPTLLELLGQPAAATSGESRASELRAGKDLPVNESYAEALYGQLHFGYAPLHALRGDGWKYIDAPRPELYDLRDDPGETRSRLDDRSNVAEAMRARLRAHDSGRAPAAEAAVDPQAAERLAALGYVGGGFFSGVASGADPKDKLQEFQEQQRAVTRAVGLYREGRHEDLVRALTPLTRPTRTADGKVVERHSFNVSFYLGRSLLALRRFPEAVAPLRKAAELSPKSVMVHLHLIQALAGAGRSTEALTVVERAFEIAPRNADLHQMKGRLLLQRGDAAGARQALEQARSLDPDNVLVRVDLSSLYRQAGDLPRATEEAEAAARLAPTSPEALVVRGLVRGASRDAEAAAADFRAALEADTDYPDALYFLAMVDLQAGRGAAAARGLERLLAKQPRYPGAREALAQARARQAPTPSAPVRLRLIRVRERARAEELARRLAEGADFAALAREASEDATAASGGELGVPVEDLALPLRQAASRLGPGQMSGVVETPHGFVLLKREK